MYREAPVCYRHLTMNILRTAAKETVRALGINVPTAAKVLLGIALAIVIAATFTAPVTDTASGLELWLIRSAAWLITVIVEFILLLAWNAFKVTRRERSVKAHLGMVAKRDSSVDEQMKSFLRNTLSDPWYGIVRCHVFGSVVRQYATRDVDIIVQFHSSKEHRVRICRDRLRSVETSFEEFHGKKLHVQTFLSAQNEALDKFLNVAGAHERII